MDRDEILRRNKESNPKDEGKVYVEDKAKRYGEIGMCVVFLLLVVYNLIKGQPLDDLLAMFWGYLGVGYFYKYRKFHEKGSLISAVCGMIAAVAFLLAYVIQTW